MWGAGPVTVVQPQLLSPFLQILLTAGLRASVLAAKTDHLRLISEVHRVKRELTSISCPLTIACVHHICVCTHMYMHTMQFLKTNKKYLLLSKALGTPSSLFSAFYFLPPLCMLTHTHPYTSFLEIL